MKGELGQAYVTSAGQDLERFFKTRYGNIFSGGFGALTTGFNNTKIPPGFRNLDDFIKTRLGPSIRSARLEFDSLNNTMNIVGETGIRVGRNFFPTGTMSAATGSMEKYVSAIEKIGKGYIEVGNARQKGLEGIARAEAALASSKGRITARTAAPFDASIASLTGMRVGEVSTYRSLLDTARGIRAAGGQIPKTIADLTTQTRMRIRDLTTAIGSETAAREAAINRAFASSRTLRAREAGVTTAIADKRAAELAGGRTIAAGMAARTGALMEMSPLPANVRSTLATSPQLERMLKQAGLGRAPGIAGGFQENVVQSAKFNAPYLDLVRNVSKVSGEFINAKNQTVRFGAEIDKNGRVVTRFGSQLSGVGGFLRMIQRDFVKVVEWTIATTAVIGGLGAAMGMMKQINEIDKLLQRFAVTAQMTAEETRNYFKNLAQVAYETATPLNEMVKVADDMALSTKKSGQTTAEWTRKITEMSNAVGMLTNISGLDTTSATEQLTSMMKQLGVETNELVGILNKITAVAGGQQQAVADITKGLAVMAESGKQAGLTVNQQIATVQVLSQVTSKSSAEVATAFKNLVGSVDSAGAIKILNEFGIQVRDAEGNARNFLLIYKDIQDAIESGKIPAGRVKEVVKGIAGGPRRAPDAAALLANIGSIFEVEKTAIQASNEALIANAKILDTNNAKLTQLKVKLDELAFEKFATILRESLSGVAEVLTGILDALNKIPNETIQIAVNILAFVAAAKLASLGIKGLIGLMNALKISTVGTAQEALALGRGLSSLRGRTGAGTESTMGTWINGRLVTPEERAAGAGGSGRLSRFMGLFPGFTRGSAGLMGAGALAGGALSLATGGTPGQAIGGALQGAGLTAMALPIPHAMALGLALTGIGTALQFMTGEAKKAEPELNSNAEAILNAATAYNNAKDTIENLKKEQTSLLDQIKMLSGKTDVDSMNASAAAKTKLAEVTASLIQSNQELGTSFDDLNKALMSGEGGALGNLSTGLVDAIRRGEVAAEEVRKIQQELELAYLKQAYPDKYWSKADLDKGTGLGLNFGAALRSGPTSFISGRTTVRTGGVGDARTQEKILLTDIAGFGKDIGRFKTLFEEVNGNLQLKSGVPKNLQTSAELWQAISLLGKDSTEEAERYAEALRMAGFYQDNITQAAEGYVRLQAILNSKQALGLISPEGTTAVLNNYRFLQSVLSELEGQASKRGPSVDRYGRRAVNQGDQQIDADRKYVQRMMENMDPGKRLVAGSSEWGKQIEVFKKAMPQLADMDLDTQVQTLRDLGANIIYLGKTSQQAAADLDLLEERTNSLEDSQKNLNQSLADTSASLYEQYINGDLTLGKYTELEGRVKNFTEISKTITAGLTKSPGFKMVGDIDNKEWDKFIQSLVKLPGFANAADLSIEELMGKIITTATNTNMSAKNAAIWGQVLQWVGKVINDLPTVKELTYNIRMNYLYGSGTTGDQGIINQAQEEYKKRTGHYYNEGGTGEDPLWDKIVAGIKKKNPPPTDTGGTDTSPWEGWDLNLPGASAKTGGGGGGTKTTIGELDIPDEWKDAGINIGEYVKKAVEWAKKYQSQIPGADKEHAKDLVAVMLDNKRVLLQKGIAEEYMRKAIQELTDQIKKQNDLLSKADTIRRIRVGAGDFAALANVPMNSQTGVSVGSSEGPISINLDINGQLLTPAQFDELANKVAAALKSKLA